jgi:phosphoribosylformylglycinamidine synthase
LAVAASQLGIVAGDADPVTGVADVVFVDGDLDADDLETLHGFLVDPLLQTASWDTPDGPAYEITHHAGVANSEADTLMLAAATLGVPVTRAATARRIEFATATTPEVARLVVERLAANPIIERWATGTVEPAHPDDGAPAAPPATVVPIIRLDDDALAEVNLDRSLSLDGEELRAIRDHFDALGRDPTDVELETIAQTWSEHCAHKTFRAEITMEDGTRVEPLLSQLRRCTEEIAAPFVRSAFVGNAGVVEFVEGTTYAVKAETHNHPSAVEPFGGANTGVGGVIRDVLGIAHRPIAVTDVLCFGPPDLDVAVLPVGSLHPSRIRDGVIDGVADYGNKIGLPTVAGAILYDPAYTTNPLVFAGCIGVAATRPLHDGPFVGDRVVVLGGPTGRDGVRGATFSSATMDASTGEVAGASVQIGDPIVEKLLIDALVGAEDLYTAITDCGAGGLSSAVGEMAEQLGARVDLDLVPRKYPGLEPWEVWLSEAQERMVVAVPPHHLAALGERCRRHGVAMTDIGSFTGDQRLVVRCQGRVVADLATSFLHGGRPQRQMLATRAAAARPGHADAASGRHVDDERATLLALLSHRNIASKAATIRRYDHEIRGATVVRPLIGAEGHADGVVLAEPDAVSGVAVGIGVNPWYGLHDPGWMAEAVVDEAIRNVVAVGADPDRVALLDNFSWGDPLRPSTLGDLVAAVEGCCAAAVRHGAPFVSGKDSLNNEYIGSDGARHAVPPTLVITAVAHVPDVDRCVTPELMAPGDAIVLLGRTAPEFAGSHLDMVTPGLVTSVTPDLVTSAPAADPGSVPAPDDDAPARYRRLHEAIRSGLVRACHDVAEGGLAVALAEMCIASDRGIQVDRLPHRDRTAALFAESCGRFVIEVAPADVAAVETLFGGDALVIGTVTADPALVLADLAPLPVDLLTHAFQGPDS